MRGVATHDRPATSGEASAFEARLAAVLDATKRRLAMLADSKNELRVVRVRSHDVVGHTRKTYERVYIARVRKGDKPKGRPALTGVMLAKKKPVFGTRLPR